MNCFKTVVIGALVLLISACGGSSPSPNPSSQTPSSPLPIITIPLEGPSGVFQLKFNGWIGVYTFLESGEFYGVHIHGPDLWSHLYGVVTSADTLSYPAIIQWGCFICSAGGDFVDNATLGRNINPTSFTFQLGGIFGSATVDRQMPYYLGSSKSIYRDPIPMNTVARTYQGIVKSVGVLRREQPVGDLIINSNGTISATAMGCNFDGQMQQHGRTGLFDLQLTANGNNCPLETNFVGIVTPLNFENNILKLALQLHSPDQKQIVTFIVER